MANWVRDYLAAHPELAALPVVKRARHSIHFRRPDGQIEAHFTGKPCHYEASPGVWQPIDTDLVDRGGYHSPTGVPVRITDGEVSIEGGAYKQKPARIVSLRPSTGAIQPISQIPGGGTVSGDSVTRTGGGWSHTIRVVEVGVRETLTLTQLPNLPGNVQPTDYLCTETAVTGQTFPDGWLDAEYVADGYRFHLPTARDATGSQPVTRRYAKTVGGVQYLYTGVPVSWLQAAAYPVVVDPDFSSMAADGRVNGGGDAVYATAHTTSTSSSATGTTENVGQLFFGGNYTVYRLFFKFDTSGIPDTAAVTSVKLCLAGSFNFTGSAWDAQIVKQDWSAQDPLSSGTREAAYDNCLSGTLDGVWKTMPPADATLLESDANLDTAWINKAEATYYSLRSSFDLAGTAPTGSEYGSIFLSEYSNSALRPVLRIVYTLGTSRVTVGWPSTVASIPNGWTRDTSLDAKFIKGAAAGVEASDTGGATTHTHTTAAHNHTTAHTHTVPNSGAASGTVANDSGSTYAPDAHTHVSNPSTVNPTTTTADDSTTTGSGSSEPTYYTVIWIGKATPAGIPDQCVAMWANGAGTPTGWGLCDGGGTPARPNIAGYLKGAAAGADGGGTGGGSHTHNTDHSHGGTYAHTHPTVTSAATAATAAGGDVSGAARAPTILLHTHALTITSSSPAITTASGNAPTEEVDPPYYKLAFVQNTSGADSLPAGLIAVWNGLLADIPSPWILCNGANGTPDLRGKFVKSAVTLGGIGGTGGAVGHGHTATGTHTHAVASHYHAITVGGAAASSSTGGSTNISAATHTHTWANTGAASFTSGTATLTINSTSDTQPPFYTVAFIYNAPTTAIKTIEGVAKASVKTVMGLATASAKTWGGLA